LIALRLLQCPDRLGLNFKHSFEGIGSLSIDDEEYWQRLESTQGSDLLVSLMHLGGTPSGATVMIKAANPVILRDQD
jgi:hypothetical protein